MTDANTIKQGKMRAYALAFSAFFMAKMVILECF